MEPLVIDHSHPTPIHAQITGHLRRQIIEGRLPRGRRLPPITQMVREFGASVGTVQRVLRDLQLEGLISARRGSGTFVSETGGASERPPGLLWVDSMKEVLGEDGARVQNNFQSAVVGGKIAFRKEQADVIQITGDYVARHAGKLIDVGEVIEEVYGRPRDEPCLFKPLQVDGRSVLMPIVINPGAIMCNVGMFEARGIPLPQADWTWSDCLEIARELTRPEANQYGFHPNALASIHTCGVWQNGGRSLSEDGERALIDTDVSIAFCEVLRALGGYCPPGSLGRGPQVPIVNRFAAGKIAMFLGSIWHPNELHQQKRTQWTCAPLPRGETQVGLVSVDGFGIRAASPVPELARDFLRLVGQLEKWPDRLATAQGLYLHADLERHDRIEGAFRQMAACSRTLLSDVTPELRSPRQEEALRLLNPALAEVIHTKDPIRPIMRRAKDSMDALLGKHEDAFQRW